MSTTSFRESNLEGKNERINEFMVLHVQSSRILILGTEIILFKRYTVGNKTNPFRENIYDFVENIKGKDDLSIVKDSFQ